MCYFFFLSREMLLGIKKKRKKESVRAKKRLRHDSESLQKNEMAVPRGLGNLLLSFLHFIIPTL